MVLILFIIYHKQLNIFTCLIIMRKIFLTSFLAAISICHIFAQSGVIRGRVYNVTNNESLPFTNIIIDGTAIGTTSDLDGNYSITGVNPGFTKLQASAIGFENYFTEIFQVTNAKPVFVDIPMKEKAIMLENVEIKASPYRKTAESPVSMRTLGISEIEKNPGGNRDISKVIQALPGVASTPAFRNDIIIRGGGPSENRFYLDGMEIPNLNHFATQGASGGPVGIINVDFIREIDFYSGAFPANRGNALSSVLEMQQVDGNPEKFRYKAALGATDLALTANGPLSSRTTAIFSVRRSYLQFLFSAIGLPFLPTYNDFQFKIKTKIDQHNEIIFIGLGALDQFRLNTGLNDPTEEQQYILEYLPVNKQWNYAIGSIYKHYRKHSYDTFVFSRNMLNNEAYKYEQNNESDPSKLILNYKSQEIENKFRYENTSRINGFKLNAGAGLEYAKYSNKTYQRVFIPRLTDTLYSLQYDSHIDLFKWSIFGQISRGFLAERLILSLGIRGDATSYDAAMSDISRQVSPRFSAAYSLTEKWYLNFNTGRFYQQPPYTTLGYRDQSGSLVNKLNGIKYMSADHIVAGLEYRRNENAKFTLEGFFKRYNNYAFSVVDSVSLASKGADYGTYGDELVTSTSKGRAYGLEVYFRDQVAGKINLIVSYTLVRSEFNDYKGSLIPSAWDNKHILNIMASRPFSKNWNAGLKWRFVGGAPYTPYDLERSSLKAAWDVRGRGYPDYAKFNSLRLQSFHQLDLRIDKEYFFKKWSLNFYADIQNLYNFKADQPSNLILTRDASGFPITDPENPERYVLKSVSSTSGTVLPTIGVIVQF
jgi:outer membrane receptor for ferrienterochelin and colicin